MARMNPNMAAIAEWRKKAAEFRLRQSELDAVPPCSLHFAPYTYLTPSICIPETLKPESLKPGKWANCLSCRYFLC